VPLHMQGQWAKLAHHHIDVAATDASHDGFYADLTMTALGLIP